MGFSIQQGVFTVKRCSAHAALAPWEGQNALDAVVSAYTNVSLLRQQLKPAYRVHAAISGRDWAPNGLKFLAVLVYIDDSNQFRSHS